VRKVTLSEDLTAKLDKINEVIEKHNKSIKLLKELKISLIIEERKGVHNDT